MTVLSASRDGMAVDEAMALSTGTARKLLSKSGPVPQLMRGLERVEGEAQVVDQVSGRLDADGQP